MITTKQHVDNTIIDDEGMPIDLEGKSELRRVHLNGTKVYIEANTENKQTNEQSNTPLDVILDDYSHF